MEMVKNVVKELGNGKSIGPSKVSNEMLKNCTNQIIFESLRVLIDLTFMYGIVPAQSNGAIIKPLVKDVLKSASDINNTRPISVSDVYDTIFEKVLLFEVDKVHLNNKKQFGFKKCSSCAHAVFTLSEVARHSRRNKRKTYLCAIDASKAFDKVNRFIMYAKFLEKTNIMLTRALVVYYSLSRAVVINNGEESEAFKTTLGVKQGG